MSVHQQDIQWFQEVFRPLHFFHILLCCSFMLKLFKLHLFPSSIYIQDPIRTMQKQDFRHFTKCIKNIEILHYITYYISIYTLCYDYLAEVPPIFLDHL